MNAEQTLPHTSTGEGFAIIRRYVLAAAALLALPGCSTLGESLGRCAFGGATPQEDTYCAAVNFGSEGVLHAANQPVVGDCKAHVLATAARLKGRYETEAVVSCPSFLPACHASTLVHTPEGDFVLDNGALRYPGNLLTLTQYHEWIGVQSHEVVSIAEIRYAAKNPWGRDIAQGK